MISRLIMKKSFRIILFLGLLLLVNFSYAGEHKQESTDTSNKPNIIFYLADDQDKLDYGCYGNEKIHTPAVDQLAKEGIMFQQAFTAQAICAPSRSQLYTGNYPLKNGCFLNHVPSKKEQKSVTHYLEQLGYEVILAGKSHVKPKSVYYWDREWKPVEVSGKPRHSLPLDSIESYFKNATKPFCMFITSEYPHGPYIKDDTTTSDELKFHPYESTNSTSIKAIRNKAGYYKNIEEDNSQLEKVVGLVDKYLDDNTLFIYSADHGKTGKFTVYDRGLNVPFIARWPGIIKANSRSDVMIHYTDVLPTFIELAGGSTPQGIDGKSFLSILKGEEEELHEYVYGVQTHQNIWKAFVFPSRMIRSKKYKYIRNFNSIEVVDQNMVENEIVNSFIRMGAERFKDIPLEELYDLENDPFEKVNLAKKQELAEVKSELLTQLYKWMKEQDDILGEEGYMPLIKPISHRLDQQSKHKDVPKNLQNTLKKQDYLELHY